MELRPGLFWARTQLPFKPGHVNVWLLADANGWTIVDPGYDGPDHRDSFLALLASVGDPPVARVLVTHSHVDHCSIAGWLCEARGARLAMARTEWLGARLAGSSQDIESYLAFYRSAGCPVAWLDEVSGYRQWFSSSFAGLPGHYERLVDGETLNIGGRTWRLLTGGGHSPEQVMLHCEGEGMLIAADHLLPKIDPAIMLRAEEPWADPLRDALHSLGRWRSLPPDTEIYPSHGEPCVGVHAIVERTTAHHVSRIEKVRGMLGAGISAYDVMQHLLGADRPFTFGRIAVLECLALLVHLECRGHARSTFGTDGVRKFAAI